MVVKMLKDLRGRMDDLSESINEEIVSIKNDIETTLSRWLSSLECGAYTKTLQV